MHYLGMITKNKALPQIIAMVEGRGWSSESMFDHTIPKKS
jgi:hypothetical protein